MTWNDEEQPFGYQAVRALFERMAAAMSGDAAEAGRMASDGSSEAAEHENPHTVSSLPHLSLALPPFAPDTAGAAAVLYPLGGMTVIVDAGGCAGNICGFDEPRWQEDAKPSAVFSAGLRDMDAIMGRDANLVAKIREAAAKLTVSFVGLVSTPVPAIIATDFRAVCRMVEKETCLPAIAVRTDGTRLYDRGAGAAYDALVQKFTAPIPPDAMRTGLGVLGLTPLDFSKKSAKPYVPCSAGRILLSASSTGSMTSARPRGSRSCSSSRQQGSGPPAACSANGASPSGQSCRPPLSTRRSPLY